MRLHGLQLRDRAKQEEIFIITKNGEHVIYSDSDLAQIWHIIGLAFSFWCCTNRVQT